MNRNNRNEYEPNIYGSTNERSQGYEPNTYYSDGQQNKGSTPNTYYSDGQQNQDNNKKEDNSSCAIGCIFLIWFFGSIALAMFLVSKNLEGLAVATFGQVFLIMGFIGYIKVEGFASKLSLSLFILAGILMILGGVASQIGFQRQVEQCLGPLSGLIVTVGGVVTLVSPIVHARKRSQVCTQKIEAVISGVNHSYVKRKKHGRVKVYAPIYDYEYNGMTYVYRSSHYSSKRVAPVGTRVDIYIDPFNPEDVYEKGNNGIVLGIIIGLFLIWFGTSLLYAIFFG